MPGLASTTSGAPSATNSAASDDAGSVHVPVVIGIVVAVIAGLVGIVFAVTYFMVRAGSLLSYAQSLTRNVASLSR